MSWCGHALRHRGRLPVPPLHQHHPCHGLLRPGSAPPALPGGIQQSRHPWSSRLPSPDRLPLLTRSLCRAPCSPHQSRPTPALQAAQHLLPVRNLGPKPWFSTFFFFRLPISFPICFQKFLQIPLAQLRGEDNRQLCRASLLHLTGFTGTTYWGLPVPTLQFSSPSPLPSLLLCFTYLAENKRSQGFLLLHLDSVSFISHKCICRFLCFFICSLRLQ